MKPPSRVRRSPSGKACTNHRPIYVNANLWKGITEGFGIHSSIWTVDWTPAAEHVLTKAVRYKFDVVEIIVLNPGRINAPH